MALYEKPEANTIGKYYQMQYQHVFRTDSEQNKATGMSLFPNK